jgi:heterodisulfide reductase subunit A
MPSPETKRLASMIGLVAGEDGFLDPGDEHIFANATNVPGVFLAGAVKGPVSVQNTIADAQAAAVQIENFLNEALLFKTG